MAEREPVSVINLNMETPLVSPFLSGSVCYCSMSCPGREELNGDSLAIISFGKSSGVLLLADGAGGTPGGNQASGQILSALVSELMMNGEEEGRSTRDKILDGIEKANRELLERKTGAGSTLCVVELDQTKIRPYHVGDSSILVVGQRGKRKIKTISHSPHGYAVESGLMGEEDAPHEDHQIEVSNLVGTKDMRIEIGRKYSLKTRDTLLLASDGVTDNITFEEITDIIRKGSLEEAARNLLETARRHMESPPPEVTAKPDDHSIILYRSNDRSDA